MTAITLLDVSLRDGGHRTNFNFSPSELQRIIEPLDSSGIEYIEVGYRNGSLHPIENMGAAGLCQKDYLLYCQSLLAKAKMAVMLHPCNVTSADLQELKACGVQLVRLCIAKGELQSAIPVIQQAKGLALKVSVNFIHLSYYTEAELDDVVEMASQYRPDIIYFADSNGSMLPLKVKNIFKKYTSRYALSFGFHAHDNLGLAQTNALAAMNGGVHFVDASLAGMGKGTGNLKLEFFIACLQAMDCKKYQLPPVLAAANFVRNSLKTSQGNLEMDEFIRGISDLSTADLKKMKESQSNCSPFYPRPIACPHDVRY